MKARAVLGTPPGWPILLGRTDVAHNTCPDCGEPKSAAAAKCQACYLRAVRSQTCSAEDCERYPDGGKGMCSMHYRRWLKRGDTSLAYPRRDPICSVDGCDRPHHANGLCTWHEQRRRAGLPLDAPRFRSIKGQKPTCWAEGCDEVSSAKGLCPMHYQRWRKHGDPLIRTRLLPDEALHNGWTKRQKTIFYKFGMTPSQFDALLASQGGRCLGCGTDKPKGKNWNVDHCHVGGQVRRILCINCNTILGLAYESGETLRRLAALADADQLARLPATPLPLN